MGILYLPCVRVLGSHTDWAGVVSNLVFDGVDLGGVGDFLALDSTGTMVGRSSSGWGVEGTSGTISKVIS